MERAHYIQERSLPELKDFIEKKIFSKDEVRQIVKKRANFEAALVRRIARKSDYLKYIAYEMGLEALRRKRVKRLNLKDGPPSISDYALIRKQFFLFERAVAKFKNDLGLWVQYIQLAKKEGAKGLASRICARALQLHPTSPPLFILASAHELDQFSPSAARSLLQRGLRINNTSLELWTEYVKMELTYVETLRRRWAVLGIDAASATSKGKAKLDPAAEPDDENDDSRQQVMQGAIVKAVMASAIKALPTMELFTSLQSLLTSFPIPADLRTSLLDSLHAHLTQHLPNSAAARYLHATRQLTDDLEGDELVDAISRANDELVQSISASSGSDSMRRELAESYASWVEELCMKLDEENIVCVISRAFVAVKLMT
ncbi:hypothetical protein DL93DRAFT_2056465 [Clavulina sp. PMI_390]|nr:hypothetical protein DL93DRAFT_2056465 [Clavulina sp. PMI_390]